MQHQCVYTVRPQQADGYGTCKQRQSEIYAQQRQGANQQPLASQVKNKPCRNINMRKPLQQAPAGELAVQEEHIDSIYHHGGSQKKAPVSCTWTLAKGNA